MTDKMYEIPPGGLLCNCYWLGGGTVQKLIVATTPDDLYYIDSDGVHWRCVSPVKSEKRV